MLLSAPAFADTNVTISWTPPTTNTDGSLITGAISYNIYRGTTLAGTSTGVQWQGTNQPRGQQCYKVTAVVNGKESINSNQACKYITFQGPTDGSIEG